MTRLLRTGSLVAIALVTAFIVSACTGRAPEVTVDDPVLIEGRELYISNCSACHGLGGGGGRGSKLNEGRLEQRLPDPADQIDVVANGRNDMPAFSGRLTESEIEAVVRYTREVL